MWQTSKGYIGFGSGSALVIQIVDEGCGGMTKEAKGSDTVRVPAKGGGVRMRHFTEVLEYTIGY